MKLAFVILITLNATMAICAPSTGRESGDRHVPPSTEGRNKKIVPATSSAFPVNVDRFLGNFTVDEGHSTQCLAWDDNFKVLLLANEDGTQTIQVSNSLNGGRVVEANFRQRASGGFNYSPTDDAGNPLLPSMTSQRNTWKQNVLSTCATTTEGDRFFFFVLHTYRNCNYLKLNSDGSLIFSHATEHGEDWHCRLVREP